MNKARWTSVISMGPEAGFMADTLFRPDQFIIYSVMLLAELIVPSMLSIPQMLWLVKHARENDSRVLLAGDSAQHRSVERGDALRILEQSGNVRYVELLQTQRQKVPALKAAIEDLKAGRLENGWENWSNTELSKSLPMPQNCGKEPLNNILRGFGPVKRHS